MRRFLREYFSFSRSELRVIVILSVLILASLAIRFFFPVPQYQSFRINSRDSAIIDSFISSLAKTTRVKEIKAMTREFPAFEPVYRVFDPNAVSSEELEQMGFQTFVRNNLIRYRESGGKFKEKSDIKKIYGFSDSLYRLWENYIIVNVSDSVQEGAFSSVKIIMVELNNADSAELLKLKGIGPYYAGKISRYRKQLGGFTTAGQLMEIYGMDEERLGIIDEQVHIDTSLVHKIDLNKASYEELIGHPYFSPLIARSIIKYRDFTGQIRSPEELLINRLIDTSGFRKLEPYIIF